MNNSVKSISPKYAIYTLDVQAPLKPKKASSLFSVSVFLLNLQETGLCLPQAPGSSSSHNGLDMTLHQFGNPFLNPASSSGTSSASGGSSSLLHHHHQLQPPQSTTPQQQQPTASSSSATSSSGGNSSSAGAHQSATNLSSSAGNSTTNTTNSSTLRGVNLIDINEHSGSSSSVAAAAAAAATAAALQHLQQLQQQGTLSATTSSSALAPGSPSASNSNSPLQQVLSSAGLLSAQAQRELLALQQRHKLQQLQRRHSLSATKESRDDDLSAVLGLRNKKALSALVSEECLKEATAAGMMGDAEILQIKAELPSSLADVVGGGDDDPEEDDNEDLDGNNLSRNRQKVDEQVDDNDRASVGVIPLNEGDDEDDPFPPAFKHGVNNPGQSSSVAVAGGSSGGCGREQGVDTAVVGATMEEQHARLQADFVKFLNRNSTSPDDISGNKGNGSAAASGNSPKNTRCGSTSASNPNGNTNSNNSNNNNNDSPKGSTSSSSNSNNNAGNSNRGSNRSNEASNNDNTVAGATTISVAGQDGQGTTMTTTTGVEVVEAAASRRASLRGSTVTSAASSSASISDGNSGSAGEVSVTGTGSCSAASFATSSGTSGISTRMRSAGSRGGEREVNTPSPLNFHQNQASTS